MTFTGNLLFSFFSVFSAYKYCEEYGVHGKKSVKSAALLFAFSLLYFCVSVYLSIYFYIAVSAVFAFCLSFLIYKKKIASAIGDCLVCAFFMFVSVFVSLKATLLISRGTYFDSMAALPVNMGINTVISLIFFSLTNIFYQICNNGEKGVRKLSLLFAALPIMSSFVICLSLRNYFLLNDSNTDTVAVVLEIALLALISVFAFYSYSMLLRLFREREFYKTQQLRSEYELEFYQGMEKEKDEIARLRHDMKNHIQSVRTAALNDSASSVLDYLDGLSADLYEPVCVLYCKNIYVNSILNSYHRRSNEEKIDFQTDIRKCDFDFISPCDLTSLVNNILSNAFDGTKGTDKPYVRFVVQTIPGDYIMIKTVNSAGEKPMLKNNEFITTKKNKEIHGYGIKIMKKIVSSYNGYCDFTFDENKKEFTACLFMKE